MLKNIYEKSVRALREKFTGKLDMQQLLERSHVTLHKTKEYESDPDRLDTDHPWGPPGMAKVWSYRLKFDNAARKRAFLNTVKEYPKQKWDDWVRWMDDISNFEGEITVEAFCRIPLGEEGKFRYDFEEFLTRLVV